MNESPLLRVLFVCRGSRQDGLGHVMRARTVAQEMGRRDSIQIAVVGEEWVDSLLDGRGLNYSILSDCAGAMEVFREYRPHIVVFDLLEFPSDMVGEIKRSAMTASLSPIFNGLGQVDIVFHRTKYHGGDWIFDSVGPQLRCGLQYTVLRRNCVKISDEQYQQTLNQNQLSVAICMGGSDSENKTLRLLQDFRSLPSKLLLWVLLGEGYAHSYANLADCIKSDYPHEVILARTTDSMWQVLRHCALTVLAGGTITYEAAHAGLPSINVFETGDHTFLVNELVEKGVCLSAGYPFEDSLSVVKTNVVHLEKSRHELMSMHKRAEGLIDVGGTRRIAEEIDAFYRTEFQRLETTHHEQDVNHEQMRVA